MDGCLFNRPVAAGKVGFPRLFQKGILWIAGGRFSRPD